MLDALSADVVERFVRWRWGVVPTYLAVSGLVLWQVGGRLGTELFPRSIRASSCSGSGPPPGSNYKLTREMALKCLDEIAREAKPENIEITLGFAGQVAPNFGMDNMVLFMRGTRRRLSARCPPRGKRHSSSMHSASVCAKSFPSE